MSNTYTETMAQFITYDEYLKLRLTEGSRHFPIDDGAWLMIAFNRQAINHQIEQDIEAAYRYLYLLNTSGYKHIQWAPTAQDWRDLWHFLQSSSMLLTRKLKGSLTRTAAGCLHLLVCLKKPVMKAVSAQV